MAGAVTALRLAGLLLLCGVGAGIGVSAAGRRAVRWQQVHTFSRLLGYLAQTLQCMPLPAGELLARADAYPEFSALGLADCRALSALPLPAVLTGARRTELQSRLAAAEETDRANACRNLRQAAELCESWAAEQRPALQQAQRLWPRLGLCAGLLVGILWG